MLISVFFLSRDKRLKKCAAQVSKQRSLGSKYQPSTIYPGDSVSKYPSGLSKQDSGGAQQRLPDISTIGLIKDFRNFYSSIVTRVFLQVVCRGRRLQDVMLQAAQNHSE